MIPIETADPLALQRIIRQCRICRDAPVGPPLPIEPNPIVVLSSTARLCIAGQAPGHRADRSSTPFDDASGDRLRDWLGLPPEIFYDSTRLAIVPMGFCFPGTDPKGGDRPPRPECRARWHQAVFAAMPQLELILAVGRHAQVHQLGRHARASMTETVADWRSYLDENRGGPTILPLPHPSWRNQAWIKRHPFFAQELLPELRRRVRALTQP